MLVIDALRHRGKSGVGKGADGDRNAIRHSLRLPPDRAAATGAEVEDHVEAAVGGADERGGHPGRRHPVPLEERGNTEGAAGTPLALETVAQRDRHGVALAGYGKSSAGAGRKTFAHGHMIADRRSGAIERQARLKMTMFVK